jgi:hypothetical protein
MPTTITGSTGVSQVQNGVITVEDLNGGGSGSAPVFGCRAWVNFDGTKDSTGAASTANTARLIRASGNVTSVVRNGTGNYTVNFTTAMPDANYSFSCQGRTPNASGVAAVYLQDSAIKSTTQFQFGVASIAGSNVDRDTTDGTVTIFR